MTTARDICKRSRRLLGTLGEGESITNDALQDCLTALNAMLEAWTLKQIPCFYIQSESFTWTAGSQTQTIGSGGDFDTDRPIEVIGANQIIDSVNYPISIRTEEQYRAFPSPTIQSTLITDLYYEPQYPLGVLYARPVPSAAATVAIRSRKALSSFASLDATVSLPPGYEDALAHNLAIRIAPEYPGVQIPAAVVQTARETLADIKRANRQRPNVTTEVALMNRGAAWNWNTGDIGR